MVAVDGVYSSGFVHISEISAIFISFILLKKFNTSKVSTTVEKYLLIRV